MAGFRQTREAWKKAFLKKVRECQGKKICGGKVFVIFFQIIEKNIYQAVILFFSFFFGGVRNKVRNNNEQGDTFKTLGFIKKNFRNG